MGYLLVGIIGLLFVTGLVIGMILLLINIVRGKKESRTWKLILLAAMALFVYYLSTLTFNDL